MNEADLERLYPSIPWREPLPVTVEGVSGFLACRLCIGLYGMTGSEAVRMPKTMEEFKKHLAEKHPK